MRTSEVRIKGTYWTKVSNEKRLCRVVEIKQNGSALVEVCFGKDRKPRIVEKSVRQLHEAYFMYRSPENKIFIFTSSQLFREGKIVKNPGWLYLGWASSFQKAKEYVAWVDKLAQLAEMEENENVERI